MESNLGLFQKIKQFVLRDIWRLKKFSPATALFVKQAKIFILTIRGFLENKVVLRASALTYYSMMSVVPIVAMAFGIAKGFGLDKKLQEELANRFEGQQEVLDWIIKFASSMLERTKGGVVAGVGIILLFWAVMRVLGNIEASFNFIWHVKKGRSFYRKFTDYIAIMLIAPVFIILSSSVTVYITTQIQNIVKSIEFLGYFSPIIRIFINLIPYVLVWTLFSFIYVVMPNIKVKPWPAIISGIVAGTLFQIAQWGYVKFQINVSSYNAIYGSFAALPLFMFWVQTGWLIVLFGAEMSYATQNFEKYEFEHEASHISSGYRKTLSLLITTQIVKKFSRGEPAPDVQDISLQLEMPSSIVRDIINNLVEAGIVSQVIGKDVNDINYQPAIDIHSLSIREVLDRLDNSGIQTLSIAEVTENEIIMHHLNKFKELTAQSEYNILLKDI
jgi:membrane protein